jgi:hypothetical protein
MVEAKMSFTIPKCTDVNYLVDRALGANAKGIPVSLTNLMPSLHWNLSGLEISDEVLAKRIKARAAELEVELID